MTKFEIDVEPIERFVLLLHLPLKDSGADGSAVGSAVPVLRWLGDQFLVSPRLESLLRVVVEGAGRQSVVDSARDGVTVLGKPETMLAGIGAADAGGPTVVSEHGVRVVLVDGAGDDGVPPVDESGPGWVTIVFAIGSDAAEGLPRLHTAWHAARTVAIDGSDSDPVRLLCDSLLGHVVTGADFTAREWAESDRLTAHIGEVNYAVG
ncbi:hypothetical protein [Prescottella subtropica]|uniref:hypothetical protein n=1 Tax=Prescottella subtropica TaxID=2545757 RepID=UPI0010F72D38|nr:hypothetical protein [Prescottella subtropica]